MSQPPLDSRTPGLLSPCGCGGSRVKMGQGIGLLDGGFPDGCSPSFAARQFVAAVLPSRILRAVAVGRGRPVETPRRTFDEHSLRSRAKCDLLLTMKARRCPTLTFPLVAAVVVVLSLSAQDAVDTKNWTAAEDHQNMMNQLGIKALRPGPSGNETAPNHANYDETTANPFPNLPDVLALKNGKKVTKPAVWWNRRRPEIVEDFEREVLGRIPKNVPKVTWEITKTVDAKVGDHPVVGKQLLGHVDNSSYPGIQVDIQMTLVLPADAKGAVPVMMMFGGRTLPEVAFPAPVFPGRAGVPGRGAPAAGRGPMTPPVNADPPATEQLIADPEFLLYAEPDLPRRLLAGDRDDTLCESSNRCLPPQQLGLRARCYNPRVARKRAARAQSA